MTVNNTSNYWIIESYDDVISDNVLLETKECKKRKEYYEVPLPGILYKHPYKCHTRAKFINGMQRPQDLTIRFKLLYEDSTEVPQLKDKPNIEITKDRKNQTAVQHTDEGIEVRSYWFNVTSYQNKNRKFRLVVELYYSETGQVAVRYKSQPFLIRAKRPIAKPGSRKRKNRSSSPAAHSETASRPHKRQKLEREKASSLTVNIPPPMPLSSMHQNIRQHGNVQNNPDNRAPAKVSKSFQDLNQQPEKKVPIINNSFSEKRSTTPRLPQSFTITTPQSSLATKKPEFLRTLLQRSKDSPLCDPLTPSSARVSEDLDSLLFNQNASEDVNPHDQLRL